MTIARLSDKNLIKTRIIGKEDVLFFPGQKLEYVKSIIQNAATDTKRSESEIVKFLSLKVRLQKIANSASKIPQNAK